MPVRRTDPTADRQGIATLLERCRAAGGYDPLSEHKVASLMRGTGRGLAFDDGGNLIGYLHLVESKRRGTFEFETAVDPSHRGRVERPLVLAALERLREIGAGDVLGWVYGGAVEDVLLELGFRPERTLHQMRVVLPLDGPAVPDDVAVRGFRPGDDAALLGVINRAFFGHLEAGNWGVEDLDERRAHDWYEPAGIRMAWKGDQLVAFCWTKMHAGRMGEVYLIATDPDRQGRHYGRMMVLEGLRFLSQEHDATVGMLYADGSNDRALQMYRRLGFSVHHTDRAYRLVL